MKMMTNTLGFFTKNGCEYMETQTRILYDPYLPCWVEVFVILITVLIKILQGQNVFPKCKCLSCVHWGPHNNSNTFGSGHEVEPCQTTEC